MQVCSNWKWRRIGIMLNVHSKFYFSFVDILHDIRTHVATVRMVYSEPVRCVIIQIKADKTVSAVL